MEINNSVRSFLSQARKLIGVRDIYQNYARPQEFISALFNIYLLFIPQQFVTR